MTETREAPTRKGPDEVRRNASGTRIEPVDTPSGYTVKPLVGGDIRKLKKIVAENFDAVREKLRAVEDQRLEKQAKLGPDAKVPLDQGAGMAVAEIILDDAFDQAWEFLANMIGRSSDELDELPIDAHLEVIETLVEYDNLPDFLGRYIRLRSTFSNVLPTSASSDTESTSSS